MAERLYIGDLARELNRVPHTIRVWCYDERLPEDLMPARDENGWRWWTREQAEGIKQWIEDTDFRPGSYLRAKARAAREASQ